MLEPEIEGRAWEEQAAEDEVRYRTQIEYLYGHSSFYRGHLAKAGFDSPKAVGGLAEIHRLPFTQKADLRASCTPDNPIGSHLAVPVEKVCRIFSTSGTTGIPSYIPVTPSDLDNWTRTSARSYAAAGVRSGHRLVSAYNAGPFAAGAALDAFNRLGVCHIPMGTGNTERLIGAVRLLKAQVLACTPSYALHLAEWGAARGFDTRQSPVERILVAGEPGGGEPAMRRRLEAAWGAKVTEAMGIGDMSISLWGECEEQQGMHFSGRGIIHFELIDPMTGAPVPMEDGAEGELVLTHLRHEAAPLLRFRTRDHVMLWTSRCACGRTAPRVRCIGRTDDMLIVRGVNLFPSAVREVVDRFAPHVSGVISVRPALRAVKQDPPLPIVVELGEGCGASGELARDIEREIRSVLLVTTSVRLVPHGSLPRSEYKTKVVDFSEAAKEAPT